MGNYSFDLAGLAGGGSAGRVVEHSTNKNAGMSLDMDGFLKLMVATLQNQTIDDMADPSEMMGQMVQMSVIQAINNISTLVSDSTNLTYAVSLVGKEVTIGQYIGGQIVELTGTVTGTGTLNGRQVIFLDDDETPYYLTDIMAVGRLPDIKGDKTEGNGDGVGEGEGIGDGDGDGDGDDNGIGDGDGNGIGDGNGVGGGETVTPEQSEEPRDPHDPDPDGALG